MQDIGNIIKWLAHALVCALVIGAGCTVADFIGVPVGCFADVATAAMHWGCVVIALWCVMTIVCGMNRWVVAGVMVAIMAIGSALAYYRAIWHYSLNPTMFDILGANASGSTMMTWALYLWVGCGVIVGGLVAFFGKRMYNVRYRDWRTWCVMAVALICLVWILTPGNRLYKPVTNRIPFNTAYVYKEYLENKHEVMTERDRTVFVGKERDDEVLTVVVIGEALRADNLGINGYRRETTPLLSKRKGVISFREMWTDVVYTNGSVPRIMTRATEEKPELAYSERSFIDLFVQAGLPTTVITNQNIEKQYVYFWNEADTLIDVNNFKDVYNFDKWLDYNILPTFNKEVKRINGGGLIVLHCIGSHWWYKAHYPDEYEFYKPVTRSRIVVNCDSIEIVNAYDNTVRFMDIIVDSLISTLEERKAQLLFISDHGEALGEDGMWLHASDCKAMHRTASFIWMSEELRESHPDWETFYSGFENKFVKTDSIYYWASKQLNINISCK